MTSQQAVLEQEKRVPVAHTSVQITAAIIAGVTIACGCEVLYLPSIVAVLALPVLLGILHGTHGSKATERSTLRSHPNLIRNGLLGRKSEAAHVQVLPASATLVDSSAYMACKAGFCKRQMTCFSPLVNQNSHRHDAHRTYLPRQLTSCLDGIACGMANIFRPEDTRSQRTASSEPGHIRKPPLPKWIDISAHVSGPTTLPVSDWSPDLQSALVKLKQELAATGGKHFERHKAFGACEDCDLGRFLLARKCDIGATSKMIMQALKWRSKRMPYWLLTDPQSEVAQNFERQASAGKAIVGGCDNIGRGILILDGSAENTRDVPDTMRFLAYNVEAARTTCAEGVDKICVICNLENLSILNSPPASSIIETAEILQTAFPETLGTAIIWQPPQYFDVLYKWVKRFLDPKTVKKIQVVCGDVSPGSENDQIMTALFGTGWQESLGLGLPRIERVYSDFFGREIDAGRGYVHAAYWPKVLQRDQERAAKASHAQPWSLSRNFALDESCWDGAYPGYWTVNLAS